MSELNSDNYVLKYKSEVYINEASLIQAFEGRVYHGTGKQYRASNNGVITIQDDNIQIIIDSSQNIIQIAKADSLYNVSQLMSNFTPAFFDNYEIEKMTAKNHVTYRVNSKIADEGTTEYYIDTKQNYLYKIKLTLPESNYFYESLDDESLEKPVSIITYEKPVKVTESEIKRLINVNDIIIPEKDGRFKLTDAFKEFELYDSRYKTN